MGKCVVCGKSCGPFNELHKTCLPTYQGTRKCLHEIFSNIQAEDSAAVAEIQACKPNTAFSPAQFKNLVIEAWEKQAKQVVRNPELDVESAQTLVNIANGLDIQHVEVEEYLLVRLSNIEHLDSMKKYQTISKNFEQLPEDIELEANEAIIWGFNETTKNEPQRYSGEKEPTVLRTVMNSTFMKKRYKALTTKTEEDGMLLVTNQGLHYKYKDSVSNIKFSEIHSITPMKTGVRVQAKHSGAMPETFITGDGRFVYTLLQYAQGLNG